MSIFQSYLKNIEAKTGKTPDDFKKLAEKKGLLKDGARAGEVVAWLKKDFDLGHGHAMAIYTVFKGFKDKVVPVEKGLALHFAGKKSVWRQSFETLSNEVEKFGNDVTVVPGRSYISFLRGKNKIAIVQMTSVKMDIGIKLKGAPFTKKFRDAQGWNAMVTHRVTLTDQKKSR